MKIHTIDQDYEYRITNIVAQMMKDFECDPFLHQEDLMEWLHENRLHFGHLIIEDMEQWSDEWLKKVNEK